MSRSRSHSGHNPFAVDNPPQLAGRFGSGSLHELDMPLELSFSGGGHEKRCTGMKSMPYFVMVFGILATLAALIKLIVDRWYHDKAKGTKKYSVKKSLPLFIGNAVLTFLSFMIVKKLCECDTAPSDAFSFSTGIGIAAMVWFVGSSMWIWFIPAKDN